MKNLTKLERVLDNLDSLADTFCAIDLANQNQTFVLPQFALTLPAEMMRTYMEEAKRLCDEMVKETSTTD